MKNADKIEEKCQKYIDEVYNLKSKRNINEYEKAGFDNKLKFIVENSKNKYLIAKAYFFMGERSMKKGFLKNAELYYKTSINYNSKRYLAHLELARTLFFSKRIEEASQYLMNCHRLDSNCIKHVMLFSKCLIYTGFHKKAIWYLNYCIEVEPEEYDAYLYKAEAHFKDCDYTNALRSIRECQKLKKRNKEHILLKAKVLYMQEKESEALEIFERYTKNRAKLKQSSINRIAIFFQEIGNKDIALNYYRKSDKYIQSSRITDSDVQSEIHNRIEPTIIKEGELYLNKNIDLDILKKIINDNEKSSFRPAGDIYIIDWPHVGYKLNMGKMIDLNYLVVVTMPFSKKIIGVFPSVKYEDIKEDKIIKYDQIKQYNKLNIIENFKKGFKDGVEKANKGRTRIKKELL